MPGLASFAEMIGETRPNVSLADVDETRGLGIAHPVESESIRREAGGGARQSQPLAPDVAAPRGILGISF